MRKALFKTMMYAGVAGMLLSGCTNDDLYNPEAVVKKYEQNWEKQFGQVDPEQTWNTAKQVTANIDLGTTSEKYTVKLYTANPISNGYLLAEKQINGNGTVSFDIPQVLTHVYAVAEGNERLIANGYYPISGNAVNITSGKVQTKAESSCNARIGKPYSLTYSGWHPTESRSVNFTHNFSHLSNVEIVEGNTWKAEDWLHIVGDDGIFKEGVHNLSKWKDRLGSSVEYVTQKGGPVELSLNYGATQNRYLIGYFYYKDGENRNDATRYVLFENYSPNDYIKIDGAPMTGDGMRLASIGSGYGQVPLDALITGSKIRLVYNDNGTPSYTFPSGVHIAFFVSKANSATVNKDRVFNSVAYRDGYNPYNNDGTTGIHTCAVTYSYRNQVIMGIEDGSDWDMNDLLFFVDGNFTETPEEIAPENPDQPSEEQGIPWIIACEDLGNTDDFDFNDIVFSVSHVAGSTKATVTPLAAGGVLASDIYFGSQRLGEIHSLLGQSGLAITNTQSGRGSAGKPIEVTVPADFSIATNMGGFSIQITDENGNNTTAIHAPGSGTAPQMICIDGSTNWAWPMERVKISDAYPGFGEWGARYQSNADWYKSAEKDKVVK